MKLNKIKNKKFILFSIIAVLVIIALLRRKPEDYEGEAGPGPGPSGSQTPEVTQEDLDAVLKFIKAGQ